MQRTRRRPEWNGGEWRMGFERRGDGIEYDEKELFFIRVIKFAYS